MNEYQRATLQNLAWQLAHAIEAVPDDDLRAEMKPICDEIASIASQEAVLTFEAAPPRLALVGRGGLRH